jgi:hypothetical protein
MKNILKFLLFTIFISCANNVQNEIKQKQTYVSPPTFVLTEMNGRELEEKAYFTINYDNTFELKTANNKTFKYLPYQHFGDEPLCNILAKDFRDITTAICIKNKSNSKVLIMIENDKISNFKGYRK